MQRLIVEDVTDTATGHMNAGLLYAHGADEGGDPATPHLGAHDTMWFAARDLVFGKGDTRCLTRRRASPGPWRTARCRSCRKATSS